MAAFRVRDLLGFLSLVIAASITKAAEPPRTCENTGLTCIESCSGLANGNYQWCGSCQFFIQCTERVTYYQPCPANLHWDEDVKACVSVSGTCKECVVHTSPYTGSTTIGTTTLIPGHCESTGPVCIPDCDLTSNGIYQWCARCDHYLLCSGSTTYIMACPPGTSYDHTVQACVYNSTTCQECYGDTPPTTTTTRPIGACEPNPCLNGGTCIDLGNGQYTCTCPIEWTGVLCESANYNETWTCGSELFWSEWPASNNFTRLCYHWAAQDDLVGRNTECHATILGIPLYNNATGLLNAGGNFGCLVSQNYPDDLQATSAIACADNYQQDVTLGNYNDSARIMVCLRYPYEGMPAIKYD